MRGRARYVCTRRSELADSQGGGRLYGGELRENFSGMNSDALAALVRELESFPREWRNNGDALLS